MLTVKLTKTNLADPQDDGLECWDEPGMLGSVIPIQLNLTIPILFNMDNVMTEAGRTLLCGRLGEVGCHPSECKHSRDSATIADSRFLPDSPRTRDATSEDVSQL